jgi:hypothetical protein
VIVRIKLKGKGFMGTMFPQTPSAPVDDFNPLAIFFPHSTPPPDDGSAARVNNALKILDAMLSAAKLHDADLDQKIIAYNQRITQEGNQDNALLLESRPSLLESWQTGRAIDAIPVYETSLRNWLLNHPAYVALVAAGKMEGAPSVPPIPDAITAYAPGMTLQMLGF